MVEVVRFQSRMPLPCAESSSALASSSATEARIHRIGQSFHRGTLGALFTLSDGHYYLIRRSLFLALSKFFAWPRPIGAINFVEARSAPSKSVSMTVTPVK